MAEVFSKDRIQRSAVIGEGVAVAIAVWSVPALVVLAKLLKANGQGDVADIVEREITNQNGKK